MNIQKPLYIGLIVLSSVVICYFAFRVIRTGFKSGKTPRVTEVTVLTPRVDIGNSRQNVAAEAVFEIKNTGTNNLVISSVEPDCHCTIAEWDHKPVAPGSITKIKAYFDGRAPGVFQKLIKVNTNTAESPQILVLKGNVLLPEAN